MEDWERYNKELEEKSKSREDLIFPEIFQVIKVSVNNANYDIKNEMLRNKLLNVETKLEVKPENREICTNQLKFEGICYLQKGDIIKAYLNKYSNKYKEIDPKEEERNPHIRMVNRHFPYFVERDLKEEEFVDKVEKLNPDNLEEILVTFDSN